MQSADAIVAIYRFFVVADHNIRFIDTDIIRYFKVKKFYIFFVSESC